MQIDRWKIEKNAMKSNFKKKNSPIDGINQIRNRGNL